jgi:mono/diheme cytochrome c family protein
MTVRLRTLAIVAGLALAAGLGAAALLVYAGVYNIAATEQHTRPVFELLDYAMRRSVQARTADIQVPELTGHERVVRGGVLYRAHCAQCHGAPGVAPAPLAFGLTPAPANLVATARTWRPAELFWVAKYGIKMTGMPAWAYRMSDEQIWDVVAFLRAASRMAPAEYAVLAAQAPPTQAPASSAPATGGPVLGDAAAGRRAVAQHLCATCHVIPGMVSATGQVGPPLAGIARRSYIAGFIANTPQNMVRWLKNPQELAPFSAMPPLGLGDRDARDIAAYLYTLDDVSAR